MGFPSYLIKRQDTYYFRQAWPKSVKAKIGKREIVKSLGVQEKGLAIRIAREFKVNLDHVGDQLAAQAHADTRGTIQLLNASLTRIKLKYTSSLTAAGNITGLIQSLPVLPFAKNAIKEQIETSAIVGNKSKHLHN